MLPVENHILTEVKYCIPAEDSVCTRINLNIYIFYVSP